MFRKTVPFALLAGIILAVVLPFALRQSVVASTKETACQEVTKAEYINNCELCGHEGDPLEGTCDEHWNIRVICGGKLKRLKILTRPCSASPIDAWNDSGWHHFTEGNEPAAGSGGAGVLDTYGNLLVPVSAGSGGIFTAGCGAGCVNFTPDGSGVVLFVHAVIADDSNLN